MLQSLLTHHCDVTRYMMSVTCSMRMKMRPSNTSISSIYVDKWVFDLRPSEKLYRPFLCVRLEFWFKFQSDSHPLSSSLSLSRLCSTPCSLNNTDTFIDYVLCAQCNESHSIDFRVDFLVRGIVQPSESCSVVCVRPKNENRSNSDWCNSERHGLADWNFGDAWL